MIFLHVVSHVKRMLSVHVGACIDACCLMHGLTRGLCRRPHKHLAMDTLAKMPHKPLAMDTMAKMPHKPLAACENIDWSACNLLVSREVAAM
jgi:hypothetical protein